MCTVQCSDQDDSLISLLRVMLHRKTALRQNYQFRGCVHLQAPSKKWRLNSVLKSAACVLSSSP